MAVPLLIAGALAAAPSIYKGIKGLVQKGQARKIDDTRPTYRIPGEINSNVSMYQNLANSDRMPGQSLTENKLNAGMASDINAIRETGGGGTNMLAAIAGLNANRNNAVNDLGIESANMRLGAMDRLSGARDMLANYKDQAFDYNQNQEFQYKRMKKNMLQNAGDENMYGAMEGLGSIGGQMMGMGNLGSGMQPLTSKKMGSGMSNLNYIKSGLGVRY
jgi:hypothetical protein